VNSKPKDRRRLKRRLLKSPRYCPNVLLNFVAYKLGVETDSQLASILGCTRGTLSKVRHRALPVGDILLLRMHEETGLHTLELKRLAGMITIFQRSKLGRTA